jgi:hypothetical protein
MTSFQYLTSVTYVQKGDADIRLILHTWVLRGLTYTRKYSSINLACLHKITSQEEEIFGLVN